mmetsp:Transcript_3043/g.3934  ORF Transcript_3043/g.3934 Transcript_3043/m.3934 type:complete len:117 (+) Transcript_3043:203-553(+)
MTCNSQLRQYPYTSNAPFQLTQYLLHAYNIITMSSDPMYIALISPSEQKRNIPGISSPCVASVLCINPICKGQSHHISEAIVVDMNCVDCLQDMLICGVHFVHIDGKGGGTYLCDT